MKGPDKKSLEITERSASYVFMQVAHNGFSKQSLSEFHEPCSRFCLIHVLVFCRGYMPGLPVWRNPGQATISPLCLHRKYKIHPSRMVCVAGWLYTQTQGQWHFFRDRLGSCQSMIHSTERSRAKYYYGNGVMEARVWQVAMKMWSVSQRWALLLDRSLC